MHEINVELLDFEREKIYIIPHSDRNISLHDKL